MSKNVDNLEYNEVDNKFIDSLPKKEDNKPPAIVIVGMAGVGKTTFLGATYQHLVQKLNKKVYTVNLDPATTNISYPVNIDIRDTINYKEVMKNYNLGPNGAILTCLNLFSTKIDKLINLIIKRSQEIDYILIDTPGQIEVFNWSASGTIILDSLAMTVPTCIAFLIDLQRCNKTNVLVSSLLYYSSIGCKAKLPILGILTKSDLGDVEKIKKMIKDPFVLIDEADKETASYSTVFSKSIALVISKFYSDIKLVTTSVNFELGSISGFENVVEEINNAKDEYFNDYLPWLIGEHRYILSKRKKEAELNYNNFKIDYKEVNDSY